MAASESTTQENPDLTFIGRDRFAAMIEVCTKTIDRRIQTGTLPQPDFHVGRQPRWNLARVLEWLRNRKTI